VTDAGGRFIHPPTPPGAASAALLAPEPGMLNALLDHIPGRVVVVGRDGSASGTAAIAVIRSDAGLAGAVSTSDDVDSQSGRITSVLAVGELLGGSRPGQYGVGRGATSVTVPQ